MKRFMRKVGTKLGFVEKNETEKIMGERAKLKQTMAKNLRAIGFTNAEVKEVLDILKTCEEEVQLKKDSLIGTNINNDDTLGTMQGIFTEIRNIELNAAAEIKMKIAEIKERKMKK